MTTNELNINLFKENSPRVIKGNELMGWQGLEGLGYIADVEHEDGTSITLVVDVQKDSIKMERFDMDGYEETGMEFIDLEPEEMKDLREFCQGMTSPIVLLTDSEVSEHDNPAPGIKVYVTEASTLRWAPGFKSAEVSLFVSGMDAPEKLRFNAGHSNATRFVYNNGTTTVVVS